MAATPSGLSAWKLVSRTRYALVSGATTALILVGMSIVFGQVSVERALVLGVSALVISSFAHALIWYPQAKKKQASLQTRGGGR